MKNNLELESIKEKITNIEGNRNYWFVRTQSGRYYDDFINLNYVAIGYDAINLKDIQAAYKNDEKKGFLAETIEKKYPEETRPNYIGNQLIDFTYNIKKGDVIVIPSASSSYISVGKVLETPIYETTEFKNNERCRYSKRKKIGWIKKDILFESLDSHLLNLKYSQRTVTHIDSYLASFIDRAISTIYIKENNAHLSLGITREEHIGAYDLFTTWTKLLEMTEQFGLQNEIEVDKKRFDIRINVQSPGVIEFITYGIGGMIILSGLIAVIVGAEFNTKFLWTSHSFKTKGLLKSLTEYWNDKQNFELKKELTEKVKGMKIKPDDISKILEKLGGQNDRKD